MQGLRTKKGPKFEKFFEIVQEKAKEKDKVFFLDNREGREYKCQDMLVEDLHGWLIPKDKVKTFEKEWNTNDITHEWIDNIAFAIWSIIDGKINVEFMKDF